jgi:hypothetical protein
MLPASAAGASASSAGASVAAAGAAASSVAGAGAAASPPPDSAGAAVGAADVPQAARLSIKIIRALHVTLFINYSSFFSLINNYRAKALVGICGEPKGLRCSVQRSLFYIRTEMGNEYSTILMESKQI